MENEARKVVRESAQTQAEKDIKTFVDLFGRRPHNAELKDWKSPISVDHQGTPMIEDILLQSGIGTTELDFDALYSLVIEYDLSYWNTLMKEETE